MSAPTLLTLAECRQLPVSVVGRAVKRLAQWDATAIPIAPSVVLPTSWWTEAIPSPGRSELKAWWQTEVQDHHTTPRDLSRLGAILHHLTLPAALKRNFSAWYQQLPAHTIVAISSSSPSWDEQTTFYATGDSNVLDQILKAWVRHCFQVVDHHQHFRELEWELAGGALMLTPLAPPSSSGEVTTLHPYTHSKVITIRSQWGLAVPAWRLLPSDEFRVDPRTNTVTFRQVVPKPQQLEFKHYELELRPTPGKQQDQPSLSEQAIQELAQLAWKAKQQSFAHLRIQWQYHQGHFIFTQLEPLVGGEPKTAEAPPLLVQGRSLQAGYIRQRCALIPEKLQRFSLPPGRIMVIEKWQPQLASLLPHASGLICVSPLQNAGALKLIREYQIPAIDKATNARQVLKQQPEIILHAGLGRVLRPQTTDQSAQPATPTTITALWVQRGGGRPTTQQTQLATGLVWDSDFIWAQLGSHPLHLAKTKQLAPVLTAYTAELDLALNAQPNLPWSWRLSRQALRDWAGLAGSGNWSGDELANVQGIEVGLSYPQFIQFNQQLWNGLRQRYPNFKNLILPHVRSAELAQRYLRLWRELDSTGPETKIWLELTTPTAILDLAQYERLGIAGLVIDGASISQLLADTTGRTDTTGQHLGQEALVSLLRQQLQARRDQHHLPIWVTVPSAEPQLMTHLLQLGIQGLVVQPEVTAVAKHVIMETEAAQFTQTGERAAPLS